MEGHKCDRCSIVAKTYEDIVCLFSSYELSDGSRAICSSCIRCNPEVSVTCPLCHKHARTSEEAIVKFGALIQPLGKGGNNNGTESRHITQLCIRCKWQSLRPGDQNSGLGDGVREEKLHDGPKLQVPTTVHGIVPYETMDYESILNGKVADELLKEHVTADRTQIIGGGFSKTAENLFLFAHSPQAHRNVYLIKTVNGGSDGVDKDVWALYALNKEGSFVPRTVVKGFLSAQRGFKAVVRAVSHAVVRYWNSEMKSAPKGPETVISCQKRVIEWQRQLDLELRQSTRWIQNALVRLGKEAGGDGNQLINMSEKRAHASGTRFSSDSSEKIGSSSAENDGEKRRRGRVEEWLASMEAGKNSPALKRSRGDGADV